MGTGEAKFYRQGCTEFWGKIGKMAEEQRDQAIFYYSWQLKTPKI